MYEDITPKSEREIILAKAKELGISTDTGSFVDIIASPIAYEIWNCTQRLNLFASIMTMDTSDGEYVIKKCRDYGIERKESERAGGYLTFSGEEGAIIPAGTVCKTSDGRRYYTLGEGIIENGSCIIEAVSEEAGEMQNALAGEINHFEATPDGIVSVTNERAFEGGVDIESIESMKERYFQKVRNSPASGNAEDYRKWAMETGGVYGARVIPLWDGPGTVKVILVGENNTEVDADIVEDAQNYIDSVKPIGAAVTVESCTKEEISISAEVELKYEATLSDVEKTVKNNIKNYFADFEGEAVYVSKNTLLAFVYT